MPPKVRAYLEVGKRRVFAGAVEWPGWCRSGRDEDRALGALVAYAGRYAAGVGSAAAGFAVPTDVSGLEVVERLEGDAGTDFGVPGAAPSSDVRPVDRRELERLVALLEASWSAFDSAAERAASAVLRKGPRGGGRDLDAIVRHVVDADKPYVSSLGARYRNPEDADAAAEAAGVRAAFLDALAARARGEPLPQGRRSAKVWTPRYAVRRSAWHALDHAWEIEDRATFPG